MRSLLALCLLSSPALADALTFTLDGHALTVPAPVVFATGGDAIDAASAPALAHVQAYLQARPAISLLRIEAHTDQTGDRAANLKLSQERALAVARALVTAGVDCKRLIPVGFGGDKPVAANDTPEGRAQNRRVSFVNAALLGRPIGGLPNDGGGLPAGDPCARP